MAYQTEIEYDEVVYSIEYDYTPEEKPIFYPNDSADPGCPASVEIISVDPYPDDPTILEILADKVLEQHEETTEQEYDYPENL